jgi:hypothetical protein
LKSNDFDQVIKRVFIMIWPWHPLITLYEYGLPPGPTMPDITALEAVINPEKTTLFISVPV